MMRSERLKKKLSKKAASFISGSVFFDDNRYWAYIPGFDGEGDYIEAWEYLTTIFNTTLNMEPDPGSDCGFEWKARPQWIKDAPSRVFSWGRAGLPPAHIMDQLSVLW